MPDEDARLPLRAVPGIPQRRAGWSPRAHSVLHGFETALRMLPDRSAAGTPRSRDYDRIIAVMFRALRRCYQDAAPYAPPGLPRDFPQAPAHDAPAVVNGHY